MKKVISKKQMIKTVENCLMVVLGTAILGFGTAVFLVPFNLATGGMTGLAIVLDQLLPFDVSIDLYISILTWFLFFVGLVFLGKKFAAKTLLSAIFYPVFFSLFHRLVDPSVLGGLFVLQNTAYRDNAVLLAAVFGGVLVGLGCAVTFIAGGSTGGVDIFAFILCKIFKKLKSARVIFAIDAIVVILGVFAINDIVLSLLGIVSAFVCSVIIDKVFIGSASAYVAHIITTNSQAITAQVIGQMVRTATVVDAMGAYSGAQKKMVIVSFNIREYSSLMEIINENDPGAFVTIYKAHETHGEGWSR